MSAAEPLSPLSAAAQTLLRRWPVSIELAGERRTIPDSRVLAEEAQKIKQEAPGGALRRHLRADAPALEQALELIPVAA